MRRIRAPSVAMACWRAKLSRTRASKPGSLGRKSMSEHDGLRFEGDAEAHPDRFADALGQRPDLGTGGLPVVHQHEGMLLRHAGITLARALQAAGLDEPGGGDLGVAFAAVVRGHARMFAQ